LQAGIYGKQIGIMTSKPDFLRYIFFLLLLWPSRAYNQQVDVNSLLFRPFDNIADKEDTMPTDIFQGINPLELSLLANFDSIYADAYIGEKNRAAELSWTSPSGTPVKQEIALSVRGNFRMKPVNCDFPPLRITFEKSDTARLLFSKNQQIKLITHCQTDSSSYELYVLEEYLMYRMYQVISDYAFRARLLHLSYINTGNSPDTITRYAFAVESPGALANRYQARRIRSNNVDLKNIDQQYFQRLCFFQYMIMNNDWAAEIGHNVELLQSDSLPSLIPVPFDFDWAGIIGIPYIIPSLKGRSALIPERIFKGEYHRRKEVKATLLYFNSKRGELYALVSSFNLLNQASRIKLIRNLDAFYAILNHRSLLNTEILKQ
jgi:hypothetical protein